MSDTLDAQAIASAQWIGREILDKATRNEERQTISLIQFHHLLDTLVTAFIEQLRALRRPGDAKRVEAAWCPFPELYHRYFRHDPGSDVQFDLPDLNDDATTLQTPSPSNYSFEWDEAPSHFTAFADQFCGTVNAIVGSLESWRMPISKGSDHSPDFRCLKWRGETYYFTANQAPVVRMLYENWHQETPDVGDETLLAAVDHDSPPTRLDTLFRDSPAWGKVVTKGQTRGTHRLSGEPPKNS